MIDRTDAEEELNHLSQRLIFASTSADDLYRWHRGCYDMVDDVQARIEAYTDAGTADHDWIKRAAGKVSVMKKYMRFVERRCVEIGIDKPLTRNCREQEKIRQLQAQVHEENKGETRRILAWMKELPADTPIEVAMKGIGAGEHRKREAA